MDNGTVWIERSTGQLGLMYWDDRFDALLLEHFDEQMSADNMYLWVLHGEVLVGWQCLGEL